MRDTPDRNSHGALRAVVVMGVSGVGKSTVGRALAEALGWHFADADDYHPAENVTKMRQGRPLSDDDRRLWLERLHRLIAESLAPGEPLVLACSALKASYRERLAGGDPRVAVVYLRAPAELVAERIAARTGHFMPPSLLESQYAALEEPDDAVVIDATAPRDEVVRRIRRALAL